MIKSFAEQVREAIAALRSRPPEVLDGSDGMQTASEITKGATDCLVFCGSQNALNSLQDVEWSNLEIWDTERQEFIYFRGPFVRVAPSMGGVPAFRKSNLPTNIPIDQLPKNGIVTMSREEGEEYRRKLLEKHRLYLPRG